MFCQLFFLKNWIFCQESLPYITPPNKVWWEKGVNILSNLSGETSNNELQPWDLDKEQNPQTGVYWVQIQVTVPERWAEKLSSADAE